MTFRPTRLVQWCGCCPDDGFVCSTHLQQSKVKVEKEPKHKEQRITLWNLRSTYQYKAQECDLEVKTLWGKIKMLQDQAMNARDIARQLELAALALAKVDEEGET